MEKETKKGSQNRPIMKRSETIRQAIIEQLDEDPVAITTQKIAETFNVTRQSINKHLLRLEKEGTISALGQTSGKKYFLTPKAKETFFLPMIPPLAEDKIWREKVEPLLAGVNPNVFAICHHGFTEMFNNVIDHSEASNSVVSVLWNVKKIKIVIDDDGVGIFEKITRVLKLDDYRHAILELSKGKLTTDPEHHTGEGIFFTSRMFDKFSILSGKLYFSRFDDDDWLIEDAKSEIKGTRVTLTIDPEAARTTQEVFSRYAAEADEFGFSKTHVPVQLAVYGHENLVSRSQAKRLLARFERFKEVFLDFEGVEVIGKAFADEIFRVFRKEHPNTKIVWSRANENVRNVIENAVKEADLEKNK